ERRRQGDSLRAARGRSIAAPDLPIVVLEGAPLRGAPHVVQVLGAEIDLGSARVPGGVELYLVDLVRVLLDLDRQNVRADDERVQAVVVRRDDRARARGRGVRTHRAPVRQYVAVVVEDQAAGVLVDGVAVAVSASMSV